VADWGGGMSASRRPQVPLLVWAMDSRILWLRYY